MTPLYFLAGQSNAARMSRTMTFQASDLIAVAEGGTSLAASIDKYDWCPVDEPGAGELLDILKDTIHHHIDQGGTFGGLIWVQGEADTFTDDRGEAYGDLLTAFYEDLRAEFGTGWTMTVSLLAEGAPNDREGWDEVRAAQIAFTETHRQAIALDPVEVAARIGLEIGEAFEDPLHYTWVMQEAMLRTAMGEDLTAGTDGHDDITGTSASDFIAGGGTWDFIRGRAGDDIITGGRGNDIVNGGAGNDLITGDRGWDHLNGKAGSDRISGGIGNDRIAGGTGNDKLAGDEGDDMLWGGGGADTFVFSEGRDIICDFEPERDRLEIDGDIYAVREIGETVRIWLEDMSVLILRNVDLNDIDGLL